MDKKRYPPNLITALHICFWLVIIILPYSVRLAESQQNTGWQIPPRFIWSNVLLVAVFYVHAYFLYPIQHQYANTGYWIYGLALLILLGVFIGLSYWFENLFPPPQRHFPHHMPPGNPYGFPPGMRPGWKPGFSLLPFFSTIALSYCYRLLMNHAVQEQKTQERENLQLKTELTFLRSQVSPHFMFNVLNNLVALARKKSDLIEPSLIRLSNLMRYMLYETDDSRITLSTEVDYLKSYIELQLLRFGDDVVVDMYFAENMSGYRIEPMLLIPFVENAFKHGIGLVENPVISINLEIQTDTDQMVFIVSNQFGHERQSKDRNSGIGLANIRRRLALIYPKRHELMITRQDNTFTTRLTLKLL